MALYIWSIGERVLERRENSNVNRASKQEVMNQVIDYYVNMEGRQERPSHSRSIYSIKTHPIILTSSVVLTPTSITLRCSRNRLAPPIIGVVVDNISYRRGSYSSYSLSLRRYRGQVGIGALRKKMIPTETS